MSQILISSCLLGRPVRYNGSAKDCVHGAILARWREEGRLVPVCPEIAAGFQTPRPPAEIRLSEQGASEICGGGAVLAGRASIFDREGRDVTALFLKAAQQAVEIAVQSGCRHAVLTDGSPSCGSAFIYDGTFSGVRRAGAGATTAALRRAGVRVWSEAEIPALDADLRR